MVSRSRVLLSICFFGGIFGILLFYLLSDGLGETRTRFVTQFKPRQGDVVYHPLLRFPDAEDKFQPRRTDVPPLPPLPPEPLEFGKTTPYTSFLSESSSFTQVEDAFFKRMSENQVRCSPMPHLGKAGDGGWNTCLAKSFRPQKPCLVYDFGVNNVWGYDEVMARDYGCTVRAFDPSMGKSDYKHFPGPVYFYHIGLGGSNRKLQNGWELWTGARILQRFDEYLQTIDILKVDIEYYEWEALENLLKTNILRRTKQLLVEVHTRDLHETAPSKSDFLFYHRILDELEAQGFRRFFSHANPVGKYFVTRGRAGAQRPELRKSADLGRTCCFEIYFINVNFVKDPQGLEVL